MFSHLDTTKRKTNILPAMHLIIQNNSFFLRNAHPSCIFHTIAASPHHSIHILFRERLNLLLLCSSECTLNEISCKQNNHYIYHQNPHTSTPPPPPVELLCTCTCTYMLVSLLSQSRYPNRKEHQ